MKRGLKLNNKGLTLIELMIGLSLFSMIMAAVFTFLVMNINFSNIAQDEIYIQEQVRNAMKVITDLSIDKESYEAVKNLDCTTLTLYEGEKPISFTYVPADSENNIPSLIKYVYTDTNANEVSKVIASDIVLFEVVNINDRCFNVTIQGMKNEGSKNETSFELTSQIFLRNYKEPEEPSA
ncbi:MAG: PilW family protein [Peptococcia bacterium]|jgi:prepilin-type N-terminal cleavage/methylation domain-containing protein